MANKQKIILKTAAFVVASIAVLLFLFPIMICRDWGFIDENTASRKGYREWIWKSRTGHWYEKSAVEDFIAESYPNELKQRWTSYAGTGRDVFQRNVLYGHGNPGPIYQLQQMYLNEWFSTRSDAEKKAFYDLLVSADGKAINDKIDSIMDDLFELRSK